MIIDLDLTFNINADSLADKINNAMLKRISKSINKRLPAMTNRVKILLEGLIKASPAYDSLLGNGPESLQANMGLIAPQPILDRLIEAIKTGMEIEFIKFTEAAGKLSFSILRSDYQDLLSISGASYLSKNKLTGTVYKIDWLDYLLTFGDRIVILDHHIHYTTDIPSRSKQAVMSPTGFWKVPSTYAGFVGNNFLTKAINVPEFRAGFQTILSEEIRRGL